MAYNNYLTVENHTSNDTLLESESGSVHTNYGAGGTITLTLPVNPESGTYFIIACQAQYRLRIDPNGASFNYQYYPISTPLWADAAGECITIVSNRYGDWLVTAENGTWQ